MVVLRCKVAVVGEATVGKSALVQMFLSNGATFPRNYQMTMGVDFTVKEIAVPERPDGGEQQEPVTVELYLFDIAGGEMYSPIADQYLEGISYFMLVYDQTNKNTFDKCKSWVDLCRQNRKQGTQLPGVLVANKADLEERQEVLDVQGEQFSKKQGLDFFQVSALRCINLNTPFEHIAAQFAKSYEDKLRTRRQQL
eukprot:TRINITY_DN39233_c0_g1_i1.p1 TRINITY_DN39233_c0_g1~~TRINITY_DN39233_c0_g1_i1.p1  ORF type:complete len:196 (+),score=82.46 TRINITY_DN39233_c0_g1_i1:68-655(+)